MLSTKMIVKSLLVLSFLIALVGSTTSCVSRRCLANDFIDKALYSPPQPPECFINVNLTTIHYETLSVDIKSLSFSSRIKINMEWTDPDLAWTDPQYRFDEVILPVNKIWTPNLTVDNAVYMVVKPISKDILVMSNGIVKYAIDMYVTVECGINLFTYPFIQDACPVVINGWNRSSCGLNLWYGSITPVGDGQGEWQTLDVKLRGEDHNYLDVTLSFNPFNAMVSLILPTALIMVVDLVSFALPLDGERNGFKIKLVFSFTMFLLILSKQLPENGPHSPLIYYHFCFCLIVLVVSLLVSMMLARLARNGSIWLGRSRKLSVSGSSKAQNDSTFQKNDTEMNSSKANSVDLTTEATSIQKISSFVKNMDKETKERKSNQVYANSWDRFCFWTYLSLDVIYIISVIAIFKTNSLKF